LSSGLIVVDAVHFEKSTLREHIVEHVFVGDALRELWRLGVSDVEVLRSEFDAHGYDLVMGRGSVVRHIQFKTGSQAKPSRVSVALPLAQKPSGCVIWIAVTKDLRLGPFFYFGGAPGEPLPPIGQYTAPKSTRRRKNGNRSARKNHRVVPTKEFVEVVTMAELLVCLFGPLT
jgi:hypothetical protein